MNNHDLRPVVEAVKHKRRVESKSIIEKRAADLRLGRALLPLREEFPSDKEFGKAVKEQLSTQDQYLSSDERNKAMWLARLSDEERDEVYAMSNAETAGGLYHAWRKKHKPKADKETHRRFTTVVKRPTDKETDMGKQPPWYTIPLEMGVLPSTHSGAARSKLRAEMLEVAPDLEEALRTNVYDEERIRDVVQEVVIARGQDLEALAERSEKEAEKALEGLSKTATEKLEAAKRAEYRALKARFSQEVALAAERGVANLKKEYERKLMALEEWEQELSLREEGVRKLAKQHTRANVGKDTVIVLSKEEMKALISALHPDRYPEEVRARLDKALATINANTVLH